MRKKDSRLVDLRSVKKMINWWASTTYEALRYSDYASDYEDLIQDGIVVFLESLNIYDPSKGCKLSSFLYRRLIQTSNNKKRSLGKRRARLSDIIDRAEYLFDQDRKGKERSYEINFEEVFGDNCII